MAPVEEDAAHVAAGAELPVGRPAARPRGRRGVPLVVRDDVVAAAMALLDEAGWEGLSMRAVCRRLGVSLPTVYAVAHSREAVVERAGTLALERWARQWPVGGSGLRAAAAAMAGRPWLFDLVRLHPSTARAALAGMPEPALRQVASLALLVPSPDDHWAGSTLDRALVVWMALELAHRLSSAGLVAGHSAEVTSRLVAAVLGTAG